MSTIKREPSYSLLSFTWTCIKQVVLGAFQPNMTRLEAAAARDPHSPEHGIRDSSTTTTNNNNEKSSSDSDNTKPSFTGFLVELVLNVGMAVAIGLLTKFIVNRYYPMNRFLTDEDQRPHLSTQTIVRRLQHILSKRASTDEEVEIEIPELNSYELQMAEAVLDPDDIDSSFADIGGLDNTKREIYELAVLPLLQPELFQGKLVQPCKGILLYGKPGTGKTMLAKALAKESQAVFIPLQLSKILSKWVGESNKFVAATFSLAHKLQPSIIFIDEIDTFLKASSSENQYLDTIKSEFLTLWDGVTTANKSRVLVLGATNKPQSIDPAIQRRMPRTFLVPLPNYDGRLAILKLLFQDENIKQTALDFLPELALQTVGYSGSDLKELCKAAAMVGIQERTAEFARRRVMGEKVVIQSLSSDNASAILSAKMRPISKQDLLAGLEKVGRTGAAAQAYGRDEAAEHQREETETIDLSSLRNLTMLLRTLSGLSVDQGRSDDIPNIR